MTSGEPTGTGSSNEAELSRSPHTPSNLSEVFSLRAERDPEAQFIITLPDENDGDVVSRSYSDILELSDCLRAVLEQHHVSRGEAVGCYLANVPAWLVASFAVWRSGAVVAAVGTLLPGVEARRLFELAGVRVVIKAAESSELGPGFEEIVLDEEGIAQGIEATSSMTPSDPVASVTPESIACILFTSGTTGRPKGITSTHGYLVDEARRIAGAYGESDAFRPRAAPAHLAPGVVSNPFGHAGGFARVSFRLWIGRPSILIPKFSVAAIGSILKRYELNTLQLNPAMIYMLATTEDTLSLDKLNYVTSGTAPLAIATRQRFESRYHVPVMQAYGMTEIGSVAQERYDDVMAGRRGPGSVGRISPGVEIIFRDIETGKEVADGQEGEICVRTSEMPDEFVGGAKVPVDEDGWFATSDVGYLDDNEILYITGRTQEKLIVGGFNVFPAEVEDIARSTEVVLDTVVIGIADERLGEIPVIGVLWVDEPEERRLYHEMRERLAHYKVPRAIFTLEAIPLTPREKVDRIRCREMAEQAVADGDAWTPER